MREMVAFTLRRAGYAVTEAVDGSDALEKLRQARFDLLITDLNMPRLDGISLIGAVRALPTHRFLPIVMLTTESSDARKQAGRAAGASGWIVKPFRGEQLLAVAGRFCPLKPLEVP